MKQILFITFALITAHAAHAGAPTGSVTAEMYDSVEYRTKFCKGKITKECLDRFDEAFYMRLHQRYPGANMQAMVNYCQAFPVECEEDPYFVEREFKRLHDESVKQEKVAEENRQNEKMLGGFLIGLGAAGAAWNANPAPSTNGGAANPYLNPPKRVKCTSYGVGGVVDTTCTER